MDDAPTNSFRNVRLSTLRLAVAAAGFSPGSNHIDKIIDDNATFHKHSLDGTKMAMSVAVVDRIDELTSEPQALASGDPPLAAPSEPQALASGVPQLAPIVEPAVDAAAPTDLAESYAAIPAADLERTDGLLL